MASSGLDHTIIHNAARTAADTGTALVPSLRIDESTDGREELFRFLDPRETTAELKDIASLLECHRPASAAELVSR